MDAETLAWLNAAAARGGEAGDLFASDASAAPAWLEELAAATEAAEEAEAEEESGALPTPDEDMPDWLRAMRGAPGEAPPEGEAAPAEDMPDWLRSLRGIPPVSPATVAEPAAEPAPPPEAPALGADETLVGRPAVTAPGEPEHAAEDFPAHLVEAELPAWLAAMRPVDVQAPGASEADSYEENIGVLAGMRGVLRAEVAVVQPHRAATPVHQLAVSATHTAHAKLLEEIMAEERAAAPAARAPSRLAAHLERWVVFLVLLAAILVAQFGLPGLFGAPTAISAEARAAFDVVQRAPADRPALVAFDFDPGQQGELEPGAAAVVTHLMRRGVPIVAVSTRPLGAALGQQVLDDVAADLSAQAGFDYAYGTHYLNLGYLPGGPVGLLQFAAAPRTAMHRDFAGAFNPAGLAAAPILARVNRLQDFGLIVVVGAAPETARAWVEQTQVFAGPVPRVAVVSAVAEPMVRPYVEARPGTPAQLQGMVAGLVGAAQYEQQASAPGAAAGRWAALGGGLLGAMLIIAVGGVVYGLLGALGARRR
jgi:hypothetical protein